MRKKERIDRILNLIRTLWLKYPEQRFFQLLFNYTKLGTRTFYEDETGERHYGIADPFHYEDDELEKELRKVI